MYCPTEDQSFRDILKGIRCCVCTRSLTCLYRDSLSVFRFPVKKPDVLEKWIEFAQLPPSGLDFSSLVMCSKHFREQDVYVQKHRRSRKPFAVPSLFPPQSSLRLPCMEWSQEPLEMEEESELIVPDICEDNFWPDANPEPFPVPLEYTEYVSPASPPQEGVLQDEELEVPTDTGCAGPWPVSLIQVEVEGAAAEQQLEEEQALVQVADAEEEWVDVEEEEKEWVDVEEEEKEWVDVGVEEAKEMKIPEEAPLVESSKRRRKQVLEVRNVAGATGQGDSEVEESVPGEADDGGMESVAENIYVISELIGIDADSGEGGVVCDVEGDGLKLTDMRLDSALSQPVLQAVLQPVLQPVQQTALQPALPLLQPALQPALQRARRPALRAIQPAPSPPPALPPKPAVQPVPQPAAPENSNPISSGGGADHVQGLKRRRKQVLAVRTDADSEEDVQCLKPLLYEAKDRVVNDRLQRRSHLFRKILPKVPSSEDDGERSLSPSCEAECSLVGGRSLRRRPLLRKSLKEDESSEDEELSLSCESEGSLAGGRILRSSSLLNKMLKEDESSYNEALHLEEKKKRETRNEAERQCSDEWKTRLRKKMSVDGGSTASEAEGVGLVRNPLADTREIHSAAGETSGEKENEDLTGSAVDAVEAEEQHQPMDSGQGVNCDAETDTQKTVEESHSTERKKEGSAKIDPVHVKQEPAETECDIDIVKFEPEDVKVENIEEESNDGDHREEVVQWKSARLSPVLSTDAAPASPPTSVPKIRLLRTKSSWCRKGRGGSPGLTEEKEDCAGVLDALPCLSPSSRSSDPPLMLVPQPGDNSSCAPRQEALLVSPSPFALITDENFKVLGVTRDVFSSAEACAASPDGLVNCGFSLMSPGVVFLTGGESTLNDCSAPLEILKNGVPMVSNI